MIRNYFLVALRNIRQSPLYSSVNILSLAIGLAACVVIFLFIKDERSFDAFHSRNANLYRLDEIQSFPGTHVQKVALSMPGMGPALQSDFPEVAQYTRFLSRSNLLVAKDERRFILDNVARVDSTFLEIFDFEVLEGDRATGLDAPYSMMITEETALKFFDGTDNVINNTLTFSDREYKVTGILKNVPENSHMQFDVLISLTTTVSENPEFNDQWGSNFLNTYLVLHRDADVKALEEKFPAFMSRHMDDPQINDYYKLFLQPLSEVHLASTDIEHDYNNYRKFNGAYLEVFFVVGIFILLIASVNFMNLSTARASHRWKELGVRKSAGASKIQLFNQFIFESVLMAASALVLALALGFVLIPILNDLIGRQLSLVPIFEQPVNLLALVGITLLLGLLSGIYPAFYMTSRRLSSMLKGGDKAEGKSFMRSSLVVVQFGLALAMIVSTMVVVQQLDFMKNKDIGFNKDQILLVDMNRDANLAFVSLKTEMLRSPHVEGVTASGQRLGNNFHQWGFKVKGDTGIVGLTPSNVNVDYDYLNVYGIKVKEGRGFSKEFPTDNGMAFIINESLAKELALKEPIGTPAGHSWYHNDSLGTIIGIVEDFNFNSLHYAVNTLEMVVHPEWGYDEMSVKIRGGNIEAAIADVKKVWESQVTNYPFYYTFLDDHFQDLYRSDQQMSAVVAIMAGLAILISCMGLFALAAITTERRVKEIGIRKVLGATEYQITYMLSRSYAILIFISFLLVSPVTYWLLQGWLEEFAYRIEINPAVFLLGAMLAFAVALITISYHTIRSARTNPVNTLRYE
ncbi:MAG: ABC transporter permease [Cyclobacteriaceae bacterium]